MTTNREMSIKPWTEKQKQKNLTRAGVKAFKLECEILGAMANVQELINKRISAIEHIKRVIDYKVIKRKNKK